MQKNARNFCTACAGVGPIPVVLCDNRTETGQLLQKGSYPSPEDRQELDCSQASPCTVLPVVSKIAGGQEKGCIWVGLGMFCLCTYLRKSFVTAEQRSGFCILGKMRPGPIWTICTKSEQKCSSIGNKKFQSSLHISGCILVYRLNIYNYSTMSLHQNKFEKDINLCMLGYTVLNGEQTVQQKSEQMNYTKNSAI